MFLELAARNERHNAKAQDRSRYADFQLTAEPTGLNEIRVSCRVVNNSRTPGIAVTNQTMTGTVAVGLEPPTAVWGTIKADNPTVVFPGSLTQLSAPYGQFDAAAMNAYKNHLIDIFIRVRIDYRDVFNRPHFTEACIYHRYGAELTGTGMLACKTGNHVDE